jgi:hypothetical protein
MPDAPLLQSQSTNPFLGVSSLQCRGWMARVRRRNPPSSQQRDRKGTSATPTTNVVITLHCLDIVDPFELCHENRRTFGLSGHDFVGSKFHIDHYARVAHSSLIALPFAIVLLHSAIFQSDDGWNNTTFKCLFKVK